MKKLILLLLFIPLVSFGQVKYKDIRSIDSKDDFLKLMVDKKYSGISYQFVLQNTPINIFNLAENIYYGQIGERIFEVTQCLGIL